MVDITNMCMKNIQESYKNISEQEQRIIKACFMQIYDIGPLPFHLKIVITDKQYSKLYGTSIYDARMEMSEGIEKLYERKIPLPNSHGGGRRWITSLITEPDKDNIVVDFSPDINAFLYSLIECELWVNQYQ